MYYYKIECKINLYDYDEAGNKKIMCDTKK